MNIKKLRGKKIAILATDGFEESELFEPKKALEDAGAEVDVIAPKDGFIKGWHNKNWGRACNVDFELEDVHPDKYDALMLPGGVMSPDKLRMNEKVIEFVQHFVDQEKPIAAICHGPWTLIETGAVARKKITSWPSIKTDLVNAGADWVDQAVVVDNGLVTSRGPEDLHSFNKKMIEVFADAKENLRTSYGEKEMLASETAWRPGESLHFTS